MGLIGTIKNIDFKEQQCMYAVMRKNPPTEQNLKKGQHFHK